MTIMMAGGGHGRKMGCGTDLQESHYPYFSTLSTGYYKLLLVAGLPSEEVGPTLTTGTSLKSNVNILAAVRRQYRHLFS
jgi:hypothetical protein